MTVLPLWRHRMRIGGLRSCRLRCGASRFMCAAVACVVSLAPGASPHAHAGAWLAVDMAAQQSTEKYTANLAKARAALAAGDFAAAERIAFALTVLDADRWEGHIAHGTALLGGGKIDEAREAFAAATSAPAEVAALAQLALRRVSGPAESAGDIASDPAADEIASKPDAEPMPAEEPLDARDKTRLDAARAIAGDLNAERDPAKRSALLAQMMTTTATVPSVRGPRIEMLFLRTIAAIELDDGDTGWNAVRELKRLGAMTDADPAFAEAVAQIQRKGWDADRKPDFVAEKRVKLEAELAKVQAEFKKALETAVQLTWTHEGPVDGFEHSQSLSRVEFKESRYVLVDVWIEQRRFKGRPYTRLPDELGRMRHHVFDVTTFTDEPDRSSYVDEPPEERYIRWPAGAVWFSPGVRGDLSRGAALFDLPGEVRWKEGESAATGGIEHAVDGRFFLVARSEDSAKRVVDAIGRLKQVTLQLEALDARVTLPTGGTK